MVKLLIPRPARRTALITALVLASFLIPTARLAAAPVGPGDAAEAVGAWLAMEEAPLRTQLGAGVGYVRAYPDEDGGTAYYVVCLEPGGFVVVAADDLVEPIICFSPGGEYDPSPESPLRALVTSDLRSRMAAVRASGKSFDGARNNTTEAAEQARARSKWARLIGAAGSGGMVVAGVQGPLSDERVPPLVETKWSQETASGSACYNYFTPPNTMGTASNYPCGCVATAMAQLMRLHQYPSAGVGNKAFTITVDGSSQSRNLRGGDGWGGAYDYTSMVSDPDGSTTQTQREAIGALCHDAGVAVSTSYASAGSSAALSDAATQLVSTFHYGSAIFGFASGLDIGAGLDGMINPNLDAGLPVLLGVEGAGSTGHALVCDGYGYNLGTLYHHLNLGWAGTDNAWYDLPVVNTSNGVYSSVEQCIYNIFKTGTGEIISGRVTDSTNTPVPNVTVTGTATVGGAVTTATDSNGIYALTGLRKSTQYTVAAQKLGYVFSSQMAATGASADYQQTSGNVWGVDFAGQNNWACSSDAPEPVPDLDAAGVESQLAVAAAGLVSDVDVALTIQHPRDSDVTAYLVGPDGTSVRLFASVGGAGQNFANTVLDDEAATAIALGVAPFAEEYRPSSALSAFDGKVAAGTWKLKVVDGAAGLAGSLVSWCLRFTTALDAIPPSCAVTGPQSPTSSSPVVFTITFSEPVYGLTAGKITVTGGTAGALSGSGSSYTLPVTPAGPGQVTCLVAADAAQDASANPSAASNTASVTYQNAGPTVAVTSPTTASNFGRTCPTLSIAGSADDPDGVVSVSWSSDQAAGGACTGTASWSASGIALAAGANVITITATDGLGRTGTATLTVAYSNASPGSAWQGMAMVSLPIAPDETDPKLVCGFDQNAWRVFRPDLNVYVSYPAPETRFIPTSATPGRGFWAHFPPGGGTQQLCGTIPPQSQPATIHLLPGWNLIGTPFISSVKWALSAITVQESGKQPVALKDAYYLVAGYAWGWDSAKSAYYLVYDTSIMPSAKGTLDPWLGYWVKAKKACDLILPAP